MNNMSHFYGIYGTMKDSRGEATRCGTKLSGMNVVAASLDGAVETIIWFNEKTGENHFEVCQVPWHGSGISKVLATGVIGKV